MSLIYNNNFNYNGSSQIASETGDMPITLVSMGASYQEDGHLYFSKTIDDLDKYIENKETADADYAEFERKVYESLGVTIADKVEK